MLVNTAILGITLALPVVLYEIVDKANRFGQSWGATPQASVFLVSEIDVATRDGIVRRLSTFPEIRKVSVVDKTEALEQFGREIGIEKLRQLAGDNPLPETLVVSLADQARDNAAEESFRHRLLSLQGIADVRMDVVWIHRFNAITKAIARLNVIVAVILGISVVLVTGNTIRSSIVNRRTEIEVAKLCGATNSFVRRPFLYAGAIQGFLGGLLACLIVQGGITSLSGPAAEVLALYESDYRLSGLANSTILLMLSGGACLGVVGAWIAVSFHLRDR